jgi:hypothetical protein
VLRLALALPVLRRAAALVIAPYDQRARRRSAIHSF